MSDSASAFRRLFLASAFLFAPSLAFAGGDAIYTVKAPKGSSSQSYVFVANDDGDAKRMRVEVRDGRMVIESTPNPDQAWLGILFDSKDDRVAVTGVVDDSPAAAAGLEVGDILLSVNGKPVGRETSPGKLLEAFRPGDRVTLRALRDGSPVEMTVKLAAHPGTMEVILPRDGDAGFTMGGDFLHGLGELAHLDHLDALQGLEALKGLRLPCPPGSAPDCVGNAFAFGNWNRPRLGVMVETMSDQLAEYFGTEPGRGVLVMDVVKGSAAERAGLAAGDVILRVDGVVIESTSDIGEALNDAEPGDAVKVEVLRRGSRESFTVEVEKRTSSMKRWDSGTAAAAEALARARVGSSRSRMDSEAALAAATEAQREAVERALLELQESRAAAGGDDDDGESDAVAPAAPSPPPRPARKGSVKRLATPAAPPAPAGRRGRML